MVNIDNGNSLDKLQTQAPLVDRRHFLQRGALFSALTLSSGCALFKEGNGNAATPDNGNNPVAINSVTRMKFPNLGSGSLEPQTEPGGLENVNLDAEPFKGELISKIDVTLYDRANDRRGLLLVVNPSGREAALGYCLGVKGSKNVELVLDKNGRLIPYEIRDGKSVPLPSIKINRIPGEYKNPDSATFSIFHQNPCYLVLNRNGRVCKVKVSDRNCK